MGSGTGVVGLGDRPGEQKRVCACRLRGRLKQASHLPAGKPCAECGDALRCRAQRRDVRPGLEEAPYLGSERRTLPGGGCAGASGEQPLEVLDVPVAHQFQRMPGEQAPGLLFACRQACMASRLLEQPGMLAGGRCAPVQVGHATRISARQLCAQELAHGLQVPVLPPRAVDRHEERASAHELAEHRAGVTPPEQGVAQRRTEPFEHRGLEQERPERLVPLRVEQLEAEIVGDVPRRAGEAGECLGRLAAQPAPRGPRDRRRRAIPRCVGRRQPHPRRSRRRPRADRKTAAVSSPSRPSVGSPELRDRPAGPSERQCELGLAASGHDDVQRLRRKIEEPPEIRVDTGVGRLLVSVQHQSQLVGERAESRRHLLGPVAGTAAERRPRRSRGSACSSAAATRAQKPSAPSSRDPTETHATRRCVEAAQEPRRVVFP